MKREDEHQRVLGFPADLFARRRGQVDRRWIRHPIGWTRWKLAVRRRGPYAPDFEDYRRRHERGHGPPGEAGSGD